MGKWQVPQLSKTPAVASAQKDTSVLQGQQGREHTRTLENTRQTPNEQKTGQAHKATH